MCTDAGGVALDGVFIKQDRDERGCGNGDERADDAGESGTDQQGDKDGDAHEIDRGLHDARCEDGVLDVDVDGIEDEDAGHLGPRVKRRDAAGEDDGHNAAGDGDDIQEAHQDAEKDEVADVQHAEDNGAADAKDEH